MLWLFHVGVLHVVGGMLASGLVVIALASRRLSCDLRASRVIGFIGFCLRFGGVHFHLATKIIVRCA